MKFGIGTKIIFGFIAVALIAGIVGYTGISQIQNIAKADEIMYSKITVGVQQLEVIVSSFLNARINIYVMQMADTKEEVDAAYGKFNDFMECLGVDSSVRRTRI